MIAMNDEVKVFCVRWTHMSEQSWLMGALPYAEVVWYLCRLSVKFQSDFKRVKGLSYPFSYEKEANKLVSYEKEANKLVIALAWERERDFFSDEAWRVVWERLLQSLGLCAYNAEIAPNVMACVLPINLSPEQRMSSQALQWLLGEKRPSLLPNNIVPLRPEVCIGSVSALGPLL